MYASISRLSITDASKMLQDLGIKQGHALALLFRFKSTNTTSVSSLPGSHGNEKGVPKLPPMKNVSAIQGFPKVEKVQHFLIDVG